jgi:hypothetical protein
LERRRLRSCFGNRVGPELELAAAVVQLIGGDGDAAHGDAPHQRLIEGATGRVPEIGIQRIQ